MLLPQPKSAFPALVPLRNLRNEPVMNYTCLFTSARCSIPVQCHYLNFYQLSSTDSVSLLKPPTVPDPVDLVTSCFSECSLSLPLSRLVLRTLSLSLLKWLSFSKPRVLWCPMVAQFYYTIATFKFKLP